MRFYYAIILSLCLWSCEKKKEESAKAVEAQPTKVSEQGNLSYDELFKLENYLTGELRDTAQVHIIDFDCAVFVYPTSEQIDEMKKEEGEEAFYTGADDSNFYQSQAIHLIDSVGVKTAGTEKKYIKFQGTEKSWTLDIRKKNMPAWNLILFRKDKTPLVTPTISLTFEMVENYFKK